MCDAAGWQKVNPRINPKMPAIKGQEGVQTMNPHALGNRGPLAAAGSSSRTASETAVIPRNK
jgi:hypothetical protein